MPSYLYCPEAFANAMAYQLSKFLEDEFRSKVFITQIHRPFEINEETYRMPIGTVSLRHAAVQCGLAVWGKNTLALTKEFGPRVGFIGLLNEIDIESDLPITDYDPCKECSFHCWEKCPGGAFTEDGKVLSHRCVKYSQPYDVGNFMRYLLQMIEKPTVEERKEMLKSYKFFNYMQYLQQFIYYQCWECTKYCPSER
jgi:epoxyqueuosine reductase QueG